VVLVQPVSDLQAYFMRSSSTYYCYRW